MLTFYSLRLSLTSFPLKIWTDKSAKLKEMVRDVEAGVLSFTDDIISYR
jgi:hypothetical protein